MDHPPVIVVAAVPRLYSQCCLVIVKLIEQSGGWSSEEDINDKFFSLAVPQSVKRDLLIEFYNWIESDPN